MFEDITRLPEHYLTRAETQILEAFAGDIVDLIRPHEIVELGSGYSVKTKVLIDAMRRIGEGTRYVPMDISEDALREAAQALCNYYPWLAVDGLVGDFFTDLDRVPRHGTRLVTFFGSTIGNFDLETRLRFLSAVTGMLHRGDALLLGVDLLKDPEILVAAYDDSAGVTAEFNKNILQVVNRELGAAFDVDTFDYFARWSAEWERIEMGLRARRHMVVEVPGAGITAEFLEGEELHNEISCKFRKHTIGRELTATGLDTIGWFTDPQERFALVLATPSVSAARAKPRPTSDGADGAGSRR
ncbi:MAG: L-histidine N(alpha)-methyltransferase [Acidimicrobiia bacterium]